MPRNDLDALVKDLRKSGINHICIEMLDIKKKRLSLLGEGRKNRMGAAIDILDHTRQYVRECTEYLHAAGMIVCKKGMPYQSPFFEDIRARLGKTLPVIQDFVNYCFEKYGTSGAVVSYPEFESVIAREGIFLHSIKQNSIRDYLLRSGFVSWKANQQIHSHKELLRVVWNDPRHRISIQRHCLFTVVGRDKKPALDKDGNVQLFFNGKPNLAQKKGVMEP